jgi:hypothetical protein
MTPINAGAIAPNLHTLLERMRHATYTQGARIIALTAPHANAGNSLIAGLFAQRLHETGLKVLLVDASLPPDPRTPPGRWQPGDGQTADRVAREAEGPDRLWVTIHPDDASRFNDPVRIRAMFETDLAAYDAIIVDCAASRIGSGAAIEAMTIAAISGASLVIGKANRTFGHERDAALTLLAECRAPLAGFVINDLIAPSLGAEIAREVRRFRRFRPRWADRLAAWAESLPLFNLPA